MDREGRGGRGKRERGGEGRKRGEWKRGGKGGGQKGEVVRDGGQ